MAASFTRTTESERRAFDVSPWTALVEASTAEAAGAAMDVVRDELARQRIDAPVDGAVYALEVCRLSVNESLE
jgi:multidrug resistance efflux pump